VILAGDVGGTKTLLGLFDFAPRRPVAVDVRSFPTAEFEDLPEVVATFLKQRGGAPAVKAACFGVAGPIADQVAHLTNVPWTISAAKITRKFNMPHVRLLNDLEAMAHAIPVLEAEELHTLQPGDGRPGGNAAIIAAGTGLGASTLPHVNGRFRPVATEGGHADFAARNDREIGVLQMLLRDFGRVSLEHVVSGPGIVNLYRFTHGDTPCGKMDGGADLDQAPPLISQSAMKGTCQRCVDAMDLFASAYGAAAGNLALWAMATAGVYLGGGIAPQILPVLAKGGFLAAFNDKAPMENLLRSMPVQVILNPQAALLGAAVYANEMI
jgi:glucokinase